MSNPALGVSHWLMTMPGSFKGKTRAEAVAAAYEMCPTRMPAESEADQLKEFEKILKMLGHSARSRNQFDKGGNPEPSKVYWELPLPGDHLNG